MSEYTAPLRDMNFLLREVAPISALFALPGGEDLTLELCSAILEEAGRFATGVLSPLNASGDREGSRWVDGSVQTPEGWKLAYRHFAEGGWNGLSCNVAHGGQGLPRLISTLVEEMWNGANVSFALCPMLTHGAIEALELRGSPEQKMTWLPRLVSGEWTGTMNLTEPQAGSDLSAIRTKAIPQPNSSYRIHGQKIFITYGDHDLTDNIVHLVLARTPDAPEGVKGISLFLVPKKLLDADGQPGAQNDVRCVSLEHKLGIHASPTAVIAFGDNDGAVGWLVGEENRGLETMFIMMNAARFSVGLEGVGLAERATQRAIRYANERIQGVELGSVSREKVAIVRHPDVRRMLLTMRARTEAMRTLACVVALAMDLADRHPDPEQRKLQQSFVDLMIPVVKGWCTESAVDIASMGVQVHGGMGYVEETGAAQHFRDARIAPIYEGTTGIQAADLIGRKIARDGGATIGDVIVRMRNTCTDMLDSSGPSSPELVRIGKSLTDAVDALETAVAFLVGSGDPRRCAVGSVPFLHLLGIVAGGWQLGVSALAACRLIADDEGADRAFLLSKIASAGVFASHVLPQAAGLCSVVVEGADSVLADAAELL